ncbi:alanine dehydrogenase [Corynebacterium sp. B5-R-101]|uniref:Alanine dehydrogenase n=1 Tax=Corynebacterium intestinale TaxID=2943492 RepID=A0ABT0T9F1_9CORY|nr:alanine dehydrogenase [Corynebacterium intestinale]MCL8493709.1 alanine dehydrogenase [Corynebacterium intestinale]MCP1389943.1 alanine dehydrogenase [Corynebacterium intestinale]
MRIAAPKEIMNNENRVALTPSAAHALIKDGHEVLVETGAGEGASFPDSEYQAVGATIVATAKEAWAADMVVKVKEPLEAEYGYLREDLLLFTYLHLAADRPLTDALVEAGTTAVAYETVTDARGTLPLLTPMSQVAGRLAVIEGTHHLLSTQGGRGLLVSGVPGTQPARVVVIGGGQVGASAVAMAHGLRAEVTVLDLDPHVLQRFDEQYQGGVRTLVSDPATLEAELLAADLVIGAVLVPGAAAPKLVREDVVKRMKKGAVLVDVAIDQGGCFENSHKTSHDEPTFKVHDTLFYCVANMPGAVANTSARALGSATLPYMRALAAGGFDGAVERFPGLANGLMTRGGELVSQPVKDAFGL